MIRRAVRLLCLALCVLLPAFSQAHAATNKPNFDLFVYRRCYTPDESLSLRLSVYNEKKVDFAAYPIDLRTLTPTSKALEQMKARIGAVNLAALHPAKSWRFTDADGYPDQ
jgi:hypothetical protein